MKGLWTVALLVPCSAGIAWAEIPDAPPRERPPEIRLALDAALSSLASSEALKQVFRDPRPSGDGYGFPSGHTSVAFALARVASEYHPKKKLLWYTLAAGVAWSRVEAEAHDWDDVIAGAALGDWIGDRTIGNGGMVLKRWEW